MKNNYLFRLAGNNAISTQLNAKMIVHTEKGNSVQILSITKHFNLRKNSAVSLSNTIAIICANLQQLCTETMVGCEVNFLPRAISISLRMSMRA